MFRIRAATHGGSSSGALRSRRPAFWSLTLPLLLALTLPGEAHPQSGTGALSGSVAVAGSGEPLAAAEVSIQGGTASTTTDARGRFLLPALPAGSHLVQVRRLGHEEAQQTVTIRAGETTSVRFLLAISAVDVEGVVISATRGSRDAMATAASVGVVEGSSIREARPAHPSEIMGRIPGVWVNVTGGEGHMTAIRQPLGTQPVYLFLEDGVPTRSTGFFNHNALYEVNVPQADRIEVLKGPGTALHGSDAIGGVISVSTRPPAELPGAELSLEGGAYGFARALGSVSGRLGDNGIRGELNLTRTDGWRDGTGYDRQAGTLRWDRSLGEDATMKTVVTFSRIDQSTAGSSALNAEDFRSNPTRNYTPVSFRKVEALRISTALEAQRGSWGFNFTPFARFNSMEMLPNWTLAFDPAISTTENSSLGLVARARYALGVGDGELVAGVDLDRSPGSRFEESVAPVREDGIFTGFAPGNPLYDYDVVFTQVAPYLHGEMDVAPGLRLQAGLRADFLGYDYTTRLDPVETGRHRRPADASPSYQAVSPKLGATWQLAPALNLFGAWRRGFRAPSEGQIFRQGSAVNTLGLDPVRADSWEAGVRGVLGGSLRYEVSAYHMTKTDDILTYQNPDGSRETVNAGETLHRGVEVGLGVQLAPGLRAEAAFSLAEHTYEDWSPRPEVNLSGNVQEAAPNTMGSLLLNWAPRRLSGAGVAAEWVHLGSYYTDPTNADRYGGHDLLNLRGSAPVGDRVQLFLRLNNVMDTRYAERAAWTEARGQELAPGMPRTLYAGVQLR